MPGTIEIRIKNGKISTEVTGVHDASCEQLTEALIEALGEVEEVDRKPQYYENLDDTSIEVFEEDE